MHDMPDADPALNRLAEAARADLALLGFPAAPWSPPLATETGLPVDDVAIVGGGQSGITIAAQFIWDGLSVSLFDAAPAGEEGPWTTFARMEELRTPKTLVGNEFNVANLSVRRWFETRYGEAAWQALPRIPRTDWKAYLDWYASVFGIRIANETRVIEIAPEGPLLAVTTECRGRTERRLARTVVLATGFDGAGAWQVPGFIGEALPRHRYDHTNGPVDFTRLKGRRVGVLGHGASAFDNAIKALQSGATSVDLCFRRKKLPRTNPLRAMESPLLMTHFPELSDLTRWQIARFFRRSDQPPPLRSFETALSMQGFRLRPATPWLAVREVKDGVEVETPQGVLIFDHLLLATGLHVDPALRPELRNIAGRAKTWGDCFKPPMGEEDDRLAQLPYLDQHFAFEPKDPAEDWLTRIFAFNSLSAVSQGPHSTSISGHRHALPRLVRGVERRLLLDREHSLLPELEAYSPNDLGVAEDFEEGFNLDMSQPAAARAS
ncbi:NAD(P)-binding domain-containing protein [Rhizobium paknamense]|uniref:Cation diffusion facilitator CzcD-associated flavoprotein CzcO n=1 Tax=Rhizobium paknamense TaxID=1206817 RepID=A0ABU0IF25_9HYPH|nr:NAD(P)/FAD-dependent oxidoreductase [Rhizobium paknamense]MDQ0456839.1 cation diffusion facilitator CzcD-associated flavoprotein CzcO [Rhizobium paknamense]